MLAGAGVPVVMSDLFGVGGQALLDRGALVPAARAQVDSACRVIEWLDFEVRGVQPIWPLIGCAAPRLHGDPCHSRVGPDPGRVFVAEIGDVTRFRRAAQLGLVDPEAPRV